MRVFLRLKSIRGNLLGSSKKSHSRDSLESGGATTLLPNSWHTGGTPRDKIEAVEASCETFKVKETRRSKVFWSQQLLALPSGGRGRRFKSSHPDHLLPFFQRPVAVVPDCLPQETLLRRCNDTVKESKWLRSESEAAAITSR